MAKENRNIDFSGEYTSIGQVLFDGLRRCPERYAQIKVDTDERDTYEALLQRSIRTAITLRNRYNIKQGDIISTCTHKHFNSCVPMIAAQFLGATNCAFNFRITPEVTISLLKRTTPKVMFIDSEALPLMEQCLEKANIDIELIVFGKSDKYTEFDEYLKPHPQENEFEPVLVDHVDDIKQTAILFFTSGTTGIPKGICINHYRFLKTFKKYAAQVAKLRPVSAYSLSSNLDGYLGISTFIRGIMSGATMLLYQKFDAEKAWTHIEKYQITVMFLVPHLAAEFIANKPKDANISSLRMFMTGTTFITKKLMDEIIKALPGVIITTGYGSTEAGVPIIFDLYDRKQHELHAKKPYACGMMSKDYEWKLVDPETEQPVGPNQEGELRIKSDVIMSGYYNMDSSTVFDSDGYYKTGDIFYYDEDDCFYFVDRYKAMFKCRGIQIVPSILEDVLITHPSVKEAIVIGVPHETEGRHPMGLVVLKDENDPVTGESIEKYVEGRVYELQRLRGGVRIVKELPKGGTGKVLRSFVQDNYMDL